MAEPSPNPVLEPTEQESTPLANGTPAPADIEMTDSVPAQEVHDPVPNNSYHSLIPPPASSQSLPPAHRSNCTTNTNTRAHRAATSVLAQQPTSQRTSAASTHTANSAWEPDKGIFESARYAAFAGGDEASGDCGAGEALKMVERFSGE